MHEKCISKLLNDECREGEFGAKVTFSTPKWIDSGIKKKEKGG